MGNSLVSEKIKTILNDKNISIQELSQRSGLTEQAVNKLLSSDKIPSLAALIKIARALGVRPGTFLDDTEQLGPVIIKATQSKEDATFSSQLSDKNAHLNFFSLAGNKSGRNMEPFIITVNAAEKTDASLSTHEGEEFIYVLSGSVTLVYGKDKFELQQGDSIYYDSIVDHLVYTENETPAMILAVVYAPY